MITFVKRLFCKLRGHRLEHQAWASEDTHDLAVFDTCSCGERRGNYRALSVRKRGKGANVRV